MLVALRQLSVRGVQSILTHGSLSSWQGLVHPGAIPPLFVLERALAKASAGEATFWWLPFLIVEQANQAVAGGCSFKGPPKNGRAEVLYGIAKSLRGQGLASAAVNEMAAIAFINGATEVLAEIEPHNVGSIGVVRKCGFARLGERRAEDGVLVEQWVVQA
jgi:[ribosomal protein S5]-alanine N-acetyltransferase